MIENRLNAFKTEMNVLNDRVIDFDKKLKEKNGQMNAVMGSLGKMNSKMKGKTGTLNVDAVERHLNEKIDRLKNEINECKKFNRGCQNGIKRISKSLGDKKDQINELKRKVAQSQNDRDTLVAVVTGRGVKVAQFENNLDLFKSKLTEIIGNVNGLKNQLALFGKNGKMAMGLSRANSKEIQLLVKNMGMPGDKYTHKRSQSMNTIDIASRVNGLENALKQTVSRNTKVFTQVQTNVNALKKRINEMGEEKKENEKDTLIACWASTDFVKRDKKKYRQWTHLRARKGKVGWFKMSEDLSKIIINESGCYQIYGHINKGEWGMWATTSNICVSVNGKGVSVITGILNMQQGTLSYDCTVNVKKGDSIQIFSDAIKRASLSTNLQSNQLTIHRVCL